MEWVPVTGYENGINLADKPRRLTEEEILYIAAHLPTPPSADQTAAEVAREGIIEWLIETLREIELAPSAIPEMITAIIDQHNKSLIAPGTPVGITAAEAVGATTTQMTLNSVAPWEKIVVWSKSFESYLIPQIFEIGSWIDQLIENRPEDIRFIPENRTQYLELKGDPLLILSPDADGKLVMSNITAVTRHLPVGDLVKITTQTGRTVTATQSKSLLIWDGHQLVQREGGQAKVGDLVPVIYSIYDQLPPSPVPALTYEQGLILAEHWNDPNTRNYTVREYSLFRHFDPKDDLTLKFLTAPMPFLRGFISKIRNPPAYLKVISNSLEDRRHDIFLDPIVSVEMVPATEYVYDLTVPATTNFSLLDGLCVADTFHTSGSAKSASFGIEAMRDLIFARKALKNETSTIYFTDKSATYEEILDKRKDIVGSMVSDFIRDYDIDSPTVLQQYWWHTTAPILLKKTPPNSAKVLRLYLNTTEMFKHRVTIAQLASVMEKEVPPSVTAIYGPIGDGIIDLYPDPQLIEQTLNKEGINAVTTELADVAYLETIVRPDLQTIRVKGVAGIKKIYPVVSPVWRIVMLERKITTADMTTEENRRFLEPHLGRAWSLYCNPSIMKMTGLVPQNLAALCQNAGLTLIAETPAPAIIIAMPNDRWRTRRGEVVTQIGPSKYRQLPPTQLIRDGTDLFKEITVVDSNGETFEEVDEGVNIRIDRSTLREIEGKTYKRLYDFVAEGDLIYERLEDQIRLSELKPSDYVNAKIQHDKQAVKAEIDRITKATFEAAQALPEAERKEMIRRPVNVPRTALMKSSEFIIADTDGSNLKELLALPGIDKRRTTCNNMYTITSTLGIEAARTFLIRSLTEIIANTSSYVHPANIMFIAEFITSRGEPYGATYTGISRQRPGHLSLATLERAGKVFTQNALHGRTEDIRNVSASVAVGARMAIGSGAFDIAQNITVNGIEEIVMNDDLFTALSRDDASVLLLARMEATATGTTEATITQEQLQADIAGFKDLTIGGPGFDFTGEEDTNLLGLFNPENFPEIAGPSTSTARAPSPVRTVRRTPAKPILPEQPFVVPTDLVDVISQLKIGIPLENPIQGLTEPIPPTPVAEQPTPQAIVSTGLIPMEEFALPMTAANIPTDIDDFLARYMNATQTEIEEPVTIVTELPRVALPQLTIPTPPQDLLAMRRDQIGDITP